MHPTSDVTFVARDLGILNCETSRKSVAHSAAKGSDFIPRNDAVGDNDGAAYIQHTTTIDCCILCERRGIDCGVSARAIEYSSTDKADVPRYRAVSNRECPAVVNSSAIVLHPVAESHIIQGEIPCVGHSDQAIELLALLACDLGTVPFDGDLSRNYRQTGVAVVIRERPGDRMCAPGRENDGVRPATGRAVGMRRRVVVGVDDRLDQRALAISVVNGGFIGRDRNRRSLGASSERRQQCRSGQRSSQLVPAPSRFPSLQPLRRTLKQIAGARQPALKNRSTRAARQCAQLRVGRNEPRKNLARSPG